MKTLDKIKISFLKVFRSTNIRLFLTVLLILGGIVYFGMIGSTSAKVIELDPADIDSLIFYILEILKIILGYLLGRKIRSMVKLE